MLGFMKDDIEVGYYNAATKIKNILVSIVTSLGTVLMPRAAYYIEQEMWEEFYKQEGYKVRSDCSNIDDDIFYDICKGRRAFPVGRCI